MPPDVREWIPNIRPQKPKAARGAPAPTCSFPPSFCFIDPLNAYGPLMKFKDYFGEQAAWTIGRQVAAVFPDFALGAFVADASKDMDTLEMLDRVRALSTGLRAYLPSQVPEALRILERSLPPLLDNCAQINGGFVQWPIGQFIADYALDDFEDAFRLMEALTQRFTSEFAVRPFVARHPARTFARMQALTAHPSPHLRRFASEGVRPRLPWGAKLHALVADPSPILPILEALKDDPETYVQRSVANNLNDIAKDHPDLVLDLAGRWLSTATPARRWIIRHGLRTLVKAGHARALELQGFNPIQNIEATLEVAPITLHIGEQADLTLTLSSRATTGEPARLAVDYCVHFVRSGDKHTTKVFKWKTLALNPSETTVLRKTHRFAETTIRRLYPGPHAIDIQINGQRLATTTITLDCSKELEV